MVYLEKSKLWTGNESSAILTYHGFIVLPAAPE